MTISAQALYRCWRTHEDRAGGISTCRFAKKEGITDAVLREAADRADRGQIDADDEEMQFKESANHVLALTTKQLAELLDRGDFVEVKAK